MRARDALSRCGRDGRYLGNLASRAGGGRLPEMTWALVSFAGGVFSMLRL
jgi:hypothetical protein